MVSVYSCIVYEHDLRLVALAAFLCVIGSWITIRLYLRAKQDVSSRRYGWLFLSGVAAGGAIWCTHFVAMIGYVAQASINIDPMMTGLSLCIAVFGTMVGFAISAAAERPAGVATGGGVVGLTIATMHYVGMMGYEIDGVVIWDVTYMVASVMLSVALSALAIHRSSGENRFCNAYGGAIVLTLAIVSLHFTGMTALDVVPFAGAGRATEAAGTFALAISVGGVGLLIVGMGVSSYLIDKSVQTETSEKLRHMALFDDLTGLPNRVQFSQILTHAIDRARESGERIAYVAVDLDGFKEINDGYGHVAGDAALRAISARLGERLRPTEAIARIGGDEFGLLKRFGADADLDAFIERISEAFDRKIKIGEYDAPLGGSIGVAVYPDDARDAENLALFADMAMYHAKNNLRIQVCRFDASLGEAESRKRRLTSDLREAIHNGDIALFYQIQKDIRDNRTIGFEALARWDHPELGMISPAEFIPLAEETGLIIPLGNLVLYRACVDALAWPDNLKVSVNVSALQMSYDDLAVVVEDTLWKSGLPADRLQLEITESVLIRNSEQTIQILREIQSLGTTIAMDDFGTGYSSLASLKAFPFDIVKLDRSFISEIEESRQAREIVEAVITICDSLNVSILAEGVETVAQRNFLLDAGCYAVQGYLYGRPAPVEECFPKDAALAS